MLAVCYPRCSTCKKAVKWLEENGLENEMFKLLASDGLLVKRPILVTDSIVLVGFKEADWEASLK